MNEQAKLTAHLQAVAARRVANHSPIWTLAREIAAELSAKRNGRIPYDAIVEAETELQFRIDRLTGTFA